MPLIDFYISNAGHHVAMMRPVVQALAKRPDHNCRIISLCEFRGIVSPVEKFDWPNVHFIKIVPGRFRSASAGGGLGDGGLSRRRRLARWVSWHGLLLRPLRVVLDARPDIALIPNDAAFPYDHLTAGLKQRQIPFILVQEGIRFDLPGTGEPIYGQGGAAAVAAWGDNSAAYFRQQGVPEKRIHLTGNPRFDRVAQTDWQTQARQLQEQLGLEPGYLLFLSNPIDDQGFCTTGEKMALISRFIAALGTLFGRPDFRLVIKLHGRESLTSFQSLVASTPYANQITVLQNEPLYPLFTLARTAVVLASSVGLEALLFDLPLGVLEIPGVGFVFDYVSEGAAVGLTWGEPMVEQVELLLEQSAEARTSARAYLHRNLAVRQDSAAQIIGLVEELHIKQEALIDN